MQFLYETGKLLKTLAAWSCNLPECFGTSRFTTADDLKVLFGWRTVTLRYAGQFTSYMALKVVLQRLRSLFSLKANQPRSIMSGVYLFYEYLFMTEIIG